MQGEPLYERRVRFGQAVFATAADVHGETSRIALWTWAGVTHRIGTRPRFSNAIGYTKFRSRSHDAVIRVYDNAGNVIETHEQAGQFKE